MALIAVLRWMRRSVTKRVRFSAEGAERLARLARRTGKTESDLIREGLELLAQREQRRVAVEDLARLAQGPAPPKARFGLG
jgi:predicted DNA-binding protein